VTPGEYVAMGVPVLNFLWWAGKRIAQRVRARRAGRRVPPMDPRAVRAGVERAAELASEVTRKTRGLK
jgi:hypothetical protein